MQPLRSITCRQLRIFTKFRTISPVSSLHTTQACAFFKYFQNKSQPEEDSSNQRVMEQKIEQIETNHQQINSRIEKLESLLADTLKNSSQGNAGSRSQPNKDEIQAELAKYSRMQNDLHVEISSLSHELSALQLAVNGHTADLSFLKNDRPATVAPSSQAAPLPEKEAAPKKDQQKKEKPQKEAKPAKEPKPAKAPAAPTGDDAKPLDASRLDLRVGKIVNVEKHPDADSLYVEQIECGEEKPRTVVSGLVKFVPLEQMQNRMVVILCNLKPAKMRGVLSEAMVMCASTPEKVEVLCPPPGSVPGDRVTFEKYAGQPDAQLNPKKKIWEQIAPDLSTNADLAATYKGDPFIVPGKGPVVAETLKNVAVK